jgi:hypothetical protein
MLAGQAQDFWIATAAVYPAATCPSIEAAPMLNGVLRVAGFDGCLALLPNALPGR